MPNFEIICLANSRKLQGRCIAGLRTDGQGWVRPVAPGQDGALNPNHYQLQDGTEPRLLDVITIGCSHQQSEPHQPENWLVDGTQWILMARPMPLSLLPIIQASVIAGPQLFGSLGDRRDYFEFVTIPSPSSLALFVPENLRWNITTNSKGNRQVRARFQLSGSAYNLSVTDPAWVQRLDNLPVGLHPLVGIKSGQSVAFVASLSEPAPWDNCCYKLIAGVLVIP